METRGAHLGLWVSADGDPRGLFGLSGKRGWRPAGLVWDRDATPRDCRAGPPLLGNAMVRCGTSCANCVLHLRRVTHECSQ